MTLESMQTLAQGHTANLKVDTGSVRVWLSRMTEEDGETQPVTFERLEDGRWVDATEDFDRHEAIRLSGRVLIRLNYNDSDDTYGGMVCVDGHVYSVCVGAPAAGFGPGIAYDSPEAFDSSAHAMLSFAADDKEWGEGEDIFTDAAELKADGSGWHLDRIRG